MHRVELWRQLEEALTTLVGSLSSELSLKNRELLTEFIENREFGVALEWVHSLTVNDELRFSASQRAEIQRLAAMMKVELP